VQLLICCGQHVSINYCIVLAASLEDMLLVDQIFESLTCIYINTVNVLQFQLHGFCCLVVAVLLVQFITLFSSRYIAGHFDSKAMPSAGLLPFFQSMFCAANNTCYPTERPSEQAGVVSSYNTSLYVLAHCSHS